MNAALYWLAKGMQLVGMILMPLGLYLGIVGGEFRVETWMCALGVVLFYSAVILERKTGRKPDSIQQE